MLQRLVALQIGTTVAVSRPLGSGLLKHFSSEVLHVNKRKVLRPKKFILLPDHP